MVIDVDEYSLEDWLKLIDKPSLTRKSLIDFSFPTDKLRDEYIATIDRRTDEEVIVLLRKFLVQSQSLGADETALAYLRHADETDPELYKALNGVEYYRRLMFWTASGGSTPPPWEGITWIIDLLPNWPGKALESLNNYSLAHILLLPDGRVNGLFDAAEIIRARYIGSPGTQDEKVRALLDLSDRDFECLVERLYARMGFETELTPPTKDGGRDIIAVKRTPGDTQSIRVECKKHAKPVGILVVRALLGVISNERATKGVIVTANRFTRGARDFVEQNSRIELVTGDEFVRLMNEYEGANWPSHIDRLITQSLAR